MIFQQLRNLYLNMYEFKHFGWVDIRQSVKEWLILNI
jgi:hypothetical protein